MNNKIVNAIFFASGVAIGSLTTYWLIKDKYSKIANEEINSVKETYKERMKDLDTKNKEISSTLTQIKESKNILDYANILKEKGYSAEPDGGLSNMVDKDKAKAVAIDWSALEDLEDEDEDEEEYIDDDDVYDGYPDYSDRDTRMYPYIIKPEEFGEYRDYDEIEFTCYDDLIVTNEDGEIVENLNELVGVGVLGHFGEYEMDAVHVRNDVLKADFEILKDSRKYIEMFRETRLPKM